MNNQTKIKLDRPDFSELTTTQRAEAEYECLRLEMIAAAFHKIMAPWDEVEVFGDLVTFTIEQSPIDGGVYLLLENTNHRIDYIEGYNYYGYNYVLRSPLASDEPMHFENVDRIVDFFIKENKDTIKYFAHQLTLAA